MLFRYVIADRPSSPPPTVLSQPPLQRTGMTISSSNSPPPALSHHDHVPPDPQDPQRSLPLNPPRPLSERMEGDPALMLGRWSWARGRGG